MRGGNTHTIGSCAMIARDLIVAGNLTYLKYKFRIGPLFNCGVWMCWCASATYSEQ